MDYTKYLNVQAKKRQPSPIRALMPIFKLPGMISLGSGLPASDMFPIEEVSIKLKDGNKLDLNAALLNEALQYSPSYGIDSLVPLLKKHINRFHNPPYEKENDWHLMVTNGSQDALTKAFNTLLDEGDIILTENPTYSGALAALRPLGVKIVGVDIDGEGLIPEKLEEVLESYSKDKSIKPPRVLYTIPIGQNPSGATLPNQRKEKIYKLACKYDLIILEDDPYWDLQLHPYNSTKTRENKKSFLSLDTEHRVLRFDSFSKILSSGIRIGLVSGPYPLIEQLQLHQQATTLHPSGLSQAVIYSILNSWGEKGFDEHISKVQNYYTNKRNIFLKAAEKYLTGLCEWDIPEAGMFAWIKVNGVKDTEQLIKSKALDAKVIMLPGKSFYPDGSADSPYVRASFSIATEEQINQGLERFSNLLKNEIQK